MEELLRDTSHCRITTYRMPPNVSLAKSPDRKCKTNLLPRIHSPLAPPSSLPPVHFPLMVIPLIAPRKSPSASLAGRLPALEAVVSQMGPSVVAHQIWFAGVFLVAVRFDAEVGRLDSEGDVGLVFGRGWAG